jgi:tetrapyrrole methylase family protein/MazG family protein
MTSGITIVGLGPGPAEGVSREGWRALEEAAVVCLRTLRHPAAAEVDAMRACQSFDALYESAETFEQVYDEIVRRVLALGAGPGGVAYAVPGDPMVGEATSTPLIEGARAAGLPLRIVHAASFLEPMLELIGVDAMDNLQIADGLALGRSHYPALVPDHPALIGQVFSRMVASELKLTLLAQYPANHPVTVVSDAGQTTASARTMDLESLDRSEAFSHATTVYVPALGTTSSFESFQETIAHLRAPEGCPWDREQTHESLRPHLMEEAYETLDAIDRGQAAALREELGDLLLQVVLHAQIASEAGDFTMSDVIAAIQAKIVRRHPHVFGEVEVGGVDEVLHNWEDLKAAERAQAGQDRGALDGVPLSLPALAQAMEIQARARRVGFDWPSLEGVRGKIGEELEEVDGASGGASLEAEIGDLLFAVVNYARWSDVDPESALRASNARFRRRFGWMEAQARRAGRTLSSMTADELDALWEAAKAADPGQGEGTASADLKAG